DVWKALTEAEELMRWFPLRAEVKPGKDGSMLWAWEESWDWPSRIDAWEPGKLLRLTQDDYRPSEDVERSTVVMEFRLETHAGKTRLHFVHSGFGQGASWDHELDSISEGWPVELGSLRVYLERYRGRNRRVGRASASVAAPRTEVWAKLIGPEGFRLTPAEPRDGGSFEVLSPAGERLTGTVETVIPGRSVSGVVKEMAHAVLRIATWSQPDGNAGAWVWLASYGDDEDRVRTFGTAADAMLKRLFPATSAGSGSGGAPTG
ncbi:MAG TPA: SRPBCC domain-containing protein, partial [Candidatus Eisenbacteria bacterium]|nr:SRPBCC domain-containing protein [Candidatus Eisenbacteria bacterium]